MHKKLLEALKQEYKNLGLADEVFERVASSAETFITDEAQIPNFVKGAEGLLKAYQSTGDKARSEAAEAKRKLAEVEAELEKAKKEGKDTIEGGEGKDDVNKMLAESVAAAVAAAIKPLQEKIDAFDGAATIEKAVNNAKTTFFGNDYVKKYKDEGNDAWERAIEVNAAGGNKWTEQELAEKAMGYFNAAVKRIGVDTTKPFESEGADTSVTDWSAEKKRLQETGQLPKDNNK